MSSEKTQMVDLLSSSKKKSCTIKNFSKDGFLIDNKLTLFSSNGYLKIIDPLNIDRLILNRLFHQTLEIIKCKKLPRLFKLARRLI